jgi:7-carboxy-7-deazaguanine synthase
LIAATVVSATSRAGSKRSRAAGRDARLKITETFVSIQGEADAVGWPTFFIRLTGCPLRCVYCDTAYAFHGGEWRTVGALLESARESGVRRVCVTGGEPLAQKSCLNLLAALCDAGYLVSLETSGAIDIGEVDSRVSRVVDIKTPDSGESARNRMDNLGKLSSQDQVKIVICSRSDYEWAREFVRQHGPTLPCQVLFSPSYGQLEPRMLAEWILEDRLDARLQLQVHKYLWGEAPGR